MAGALRVIRAAECRRMPWKNGGGETVEIACFPEGAGLAEFQWRVSSALVAGAGPFSLFPGVDRTLSVLSGEALRLDFADGAQVRLDRTSVPFAFPADVAVAGAPQGGAITDLNVMTRRGRFTHRVACLDGAGPTGIQVEPDAFALAFVAAGAADARDTHSGEAVRLLAGDTVLAHRGSFVMTPVSADCRLYLIEIAPASGTR